MSTTDSRTDKTTRKKSKSPAPHPKDTAVPQAPEDKPFAFTDFASI